MTGPKNMRGTCGEHAGNMRGTWGDMLGASLGDVGNMRGAWGEHWATYMWGSCGIMRWGLGGATCKQGCAGACNGPCAMGSKTNHLYPQRGKL